MTDRPATTDAGPEPPLRQQSVVEIGATRVTVTSDVLLEPEPMIVTSIHAGGNPIRKTHIALPASAVAEYQSFGIEALGPTLLAYHLRYLRKLLAVDDGRAEVGPGDRVRAGELGTIDLDAGGAMIAAVGEDQVPGGWLRAAFLWTGLVDILGSRLDIGPLERGIAFGDGIAATLAHRGDGSRITFVDPRRMTHDAALLRALEGLECTPQ